MTRCSGAFVPFIHQSSAVFHLPLRRFTLHAYRTCAPLCAAPKGFGDFRRNLKREQVMEDRYAQIEHENRLLLSKMSDIMQVGALASCRLCFAMHATLFDARPATVSALNRNSAYRHHRRLALPRSAEGLA